MDSSAFWLNQVKSGINTENSKVNELSVNNQNESRRVANTYRSVENTRPDSANNKFDLNIRTYYTMIDGKRVPSKLEHNGKVVTTAENFESPEQFEEFIKKFMDEKR